jgi:uncharacterized protein YndB with AHSA1/START domain
MSEYRYSTTVESPRDTIFDVLMDPSNLPRFVSHIEAAEPLGDDGVLIRGRGFAFGASVRIVDVLRRLEWTIGADWSGWVQVDGDDDAGVAQVRAEVRCAPRSRGRSAVRTRVNARVGDVGELLSASVLALKSLVEAMPGVSTAPRAE